MISEPQPPAESAGETLTLQAIIKSLPKACFTKDPRKAWTGLAINVLMVGLGYVAIAYAPIYLLPLAWIWAGTAATGLFVIAHECGHRLFSNRRWVNDLVGHLTTLPLIYPFHGWRILHDWHHKHTNELGVDNAWSPYTPDDYAAMGGGMRWFYKQLRGWAWWFASIAHWAKLHFDWRPFTGKQREQIRFSALLVIGFAVVGLPLLLWSVGVWGLVKFWLVPWLIFHFWLSTFTLVHHTTLDIPFTPTAQWNPALAQLLGTVHCQYPAWVEFLCHDINVHIPHHVSTAIPSYNLRMAHASLNATWGEQLQKRQFGWALMREITTRCHLYDADANYRPFPG